MPGKKYIILEELLELFASGQDDKAIQEAYIAYDTLAQLTPTRLMHLLKSGLENVLGLLLDPPFFPKREKLAEGLPKAYQRVQEDGKKRNLGHLQGVIGLVCLMLDLLDIAERQGQISSPITFNSPKNLLKDQQVRYWFKQIYAPGLIPDTPQNKSVNSEEEKNAELHWQNLDLDSLELHRVGTTSFILHCRVTVLTGKRLALKCLLFPYTRDPNITDATRQYAINYPAEKANQVPAITRVHSSADKWILMDFEDGDTLREFLQIRRNAEYKDKIGLLLRTDLLTSIGKPLLATLNDLSRIGLKHEDLTPSNIIIHSAQNGSIDRIAFIDFGRNFLYTRRLGLEASREALFVAPEIKIEQRSQETSDLYSFGVILIDLADPVEVQGITIPDSIYQYAPHLARFIEDLIDKEPKNRRLIFSPKNGGDLNGTFDSLLKVIPSKHEMEPGRFLWAQQLIALFFPKEQLTHALELWRITRSSPVIAKDAGRLFGWLVISTANSLLLFTICITWGARDFGMNNPFLPFYISIPQTLIPNCGGICLPGIPNYIFGPINLPSRLIGFSIVLAQAPFYTNILAGLTVRSMSGKFASVTEFFLRTMAVITFPFVLIGELYQPQWWLPLAAMGYAITAITCILCSQLAIRTLNKAKEEKLSGVPRDDPSLKNFSQWGITTTFYIMLIIGIWVGLQIGFLHDALAYAIVGTAVNVFVLCISKSIVLAPSVRGSLSRAFILGERLERIQQRTTPSNNIP